MKSYVVITGGGSGIGRAVAQRLAQKNISVLIAGRSLQSLKETQSFAKDVINIVQADIATKEGREAILNAIPVNTKSAYLIQNAAIVEGCELKDVTLESWKYQMAVNLEGPLFLTQKLLPFLQGGRILHISSGFAHMAAAGLGPYCISKAAFYMMYKCLEVELNKMNIQVGSLRPGVVDTPFQEKMRSFPEEIFPAVEKFKTMKEEGNLQSSEKIARFIEWVLFNTDNSKFSEAEWNIADAWHQEEWQIK